MKSVLIALENQNINTNILNLLISSLKCEISVITSTPENLIATIKKTTKRSKTIFVCNEFLENLENRDVYLNFFGDESTVTDENGKIIGVYSVIKKTPIAFLPANVSEAEKFIFSYFYKNEENADFSYNAMGSIYVTNENSAYFEQTLNELLNKNNPIISIKHHDIFSQIDIAAYGTTQDEANDLLNNTSNQIKLLLGDDVFSLESSKIEQIAVKLLLEKNIKIATAESCTGGLLSELITSVPNSSNVFELGITSYSNRIKQYALSVNKETLRNYGAISKQTATEMALGVRKLSGADIGVAITGVAGPSSSEGKPVGTVYIAMCDAYHFWVRKLSLSAFASREDIRNAACFTAFDLIRRYIECSPQILPEYSNSLQNINCLLCQPHYINSSLLFMKNSLNEFLINEQEDGLQSKDTNEEFIITEINTPLERLQKKVIKKHGVKFHFKLPEINFSLKEYYNRLITTNDIKGFMLNSLIKVTVLILISAMLMVTVISADFFADDYSQKKLLETLSSYWSDTEIKSIDGTYYDFQKLNKINPDISAWITINGTSINNPVCTYKENDYYKNFNYQNKPSKYGALYFNQNTNFENDSKNIVIFGNNLQNATMFSDLTKFKDKKFASNSQIIKLTTKKNITNYEVFAVLTLTDNPSHENKNDFFNYTRTEFSSQNEFSRWISEIKLRSLYDSTASVDSSDKILTLVTDSFEFSSAKTVVFAKAITDDSLLETNRLTINSEPKLPYIWYKINGLESPYHYSIDYTVENN